MKTINGNNKIERNINKAKKYFGIDLISESNKFFEIKDQNKLKGWYIAANWKLVKNGELILIEPINSAKPFFVKSWATMVTSDKEIMWKPFTETDKKRLAKLIIGDDDVTLVSELKRDISINKKRAFGNQ